MSKHIEFEWKTGDCLHDATSLFEEMSHIGGNQKMRCDANDALEEIRLWLRPRAVCECYDAFALEGEDLILCDAGGTEHKLTCKAFSQIDPRTIDSVCVFALTAGDCHAGSDRIMIQLFADYWGTAITETVKRLFMGSLKKELALQQAAPVMLSEVFGPGLFGMELGEMAKLPSLCDFAKAGISVSESCYLMPEKSVAGLIFKVNGGYVKLHGKCETCDGNPISCILCLSQKNE